MPPQTSIEVSVYNTRTQDPCPAKQVETTLGLVSCDEGEISLMVRPGDAKVRTGSLQKRSLDDRRCAYRVMHLRELAHRDDILIADWDYPTSHILWASCGTRADQ